MAQDIQGFYTQAQAKDFARLFQFRLERIGQTGFGDNELVYIETATLPGRSISNQQVQYMGLQFNIPGSATYPGSESYPVNFRCDQNYDIRSVLEQATINVFDDATSTGNYDTPAAGSQIVMVLLNKQLKPILKYTLYGAYVQNVQEVGYDIKDTGGIVTFSATLAYQYWRKTRVGNAQTRNAFV